MSDLFAPIFAAVLGANILTGMFFWGLMTYSRLEREGRAGEAHRVVYICLFLPLAFGAFAMFALKS